MIHFPHFAPLFNAFLSMFISLWKEMGCVFVFTWVSDCICTIIPFSLIRQSDEHPWLWLSTHVFPSTLAFMPIIILVAFLLCSTLAYYWFPQQATIPALTTTVKYKSEKEGPRFLINSAIHKCLHKFCHFLSLVWIHFIDTSHEAGDPKKCTLFRDGKGFLPDAHSCLKQLWLRKIRSP